MPIYDMGTLPHRPCRAGSAATSIVGGRLSGESLEPTHRRWLIPTVNSISVPFFQVLMIALFIPTWQHSSTLHAVRGKAFSNMSLQAMIGAR